MCQNSTDSQKPLSGAWANVQGQATAQLQLSNQSPVMCQLASSVMKASMHDNTTSTVPAAGLRRHPQCDELARVILT
jgi:hypothetical protein